MACFYVMSAKSVWQTQLHLDNGIPNFFQIEADSLQSAMRQSEYFPISL
jgi:hypothetical protein